MACLFSSISKFQRSLSLYAFEVSCHRISKSEQLISQTKFTKAGRNQRFCASSINCWWRSCPHLSLAPCSVKFSAAVLAIRIFDRMIMPQRNSAHPNRLLWCLIGIQKESSSYFQSAAWHKVWSPYWKALLWSGSRLLWNYQDKCIHCHGWTMFHRWWRSPKIDREGWIRSLCSIFDQGKDISIRLFWNQGFYCWR